MGNQSCPYQWSREGHIPRHPNEGEKQEGEEQEEQAHDQIFHPIEPGSSPAHNHQHNINNNSTERVFMEHFYECDNNYLKLINKKYSTFCKCTSNNLQL